MKGIKKKITTCNRCPRLRAHCLEIARIKRKSFQNETYWGKPVPGFGDPHARLWIIGLAPAAHGANRTGRMFTGDRSGDWLYRALFKAGFASQALAQSKNDGLILKDCFISAVARCAPPDNKPLPVEMDRCHEFLEMEFRALKKNLHVVIALGGIAWDRAWGLLKPPRKKIKFAHGAQAQLSRQMMLLASYHPSQQNTFTGKLTEPMFDQIFSKARAYLV